jgi:hypothetical protein
MKKLLLATALLLPALPASASADGGGVAHVLVGQQGVLAPSGKLRYVALTTGRHTILSVVRVRGGRVVRWRLLRGYLGVPVVSLDGTTDGVSGDGRTLVLSNAPGGTQTTFVFVDTRTLRARRLVLPGSWSFDAISPNGSILYLVEYTSISPNPAYRVRAYDTAARRLLLRPIVDREIGERLMRGWAVTRANTANGRWAYTLYARQKHAPFVHALDTESRRAYCIDLPLELRRTEQMGLELRLRGERLDVRRGATTVAVVDTRTFSVHRH